ELEWHEVQVFIQFTVDGLIDKLLATGGGDVVESMARPLSRAVLMKVLGVGKEHQLLLEQSIDRLMLEFKRPTRALEPSDPVQSSIEALQTIIDAACRDGCGGLMASLATTRAGQEALSEREVIANLALLFAAGHGTTANLIANGLFALLRNPRQMS